MTLKVTRWISGDVKPERVGVYQRMLGCNIKFSKWDGENWLSWANTADMAAHCRLESEFQEVYWRGLNSKPKGTT